MAAYFIDLDGVFFLYGTMIPTEGAIQSVMQLWREGHQVFFTTRRTAEGNNPPELDIANTEKTLRLLAVPYTAIISGVLSPRILINDDGALAINHIRNEPFTIVSDATSVREFHQTRSESRARSKRDLTERIYDILATIAWASWSYAVPADADDYVQTIQIAQSLCSNGGFSHQDLVARYRSPVNISLRGVKLYCGGIAQSYKGQLAKLLASSDPRYLATDGVSDGSAMKVAPIASFYCSDFRELILATDRIARVTHASIEARLAAVLIALRFQEVLLEEDDGDPTTFVSRFRHAVSLLGFENTAEFFLSRVVKAAEITRKEFTGIGLLVKLAEEIGLTHLAWGTPIAACFWSFRADYDIKKWMSLCVQEKAIVYPLFNMDPFHVPVGESPQGLGNRRLVDFSQITGSTLKRYVHEEDRQHLVRIGEFESFIKAHGYHWGKGIDSDTFFSIAFSILAGKYGIDKISEEIPDAVAAFGDDLHGIAKELAKGPQSLTARS